MLFNPVYEFERMQSLIDGLFSGYPSENYRNEDMNLANVFENQNGYMLQFLAPGVAIEDIGINITNGILSASVKRRSDKKDEKDFLLLRQERSELDFTRSYRLSDDADAEKIDAKMMNGILMIFVPKKEQAKTKKITVKVN